MYKQYNINFLNPVDAIIPSYDQCGANICHVINSKGTKTIAQVNVSKFLRLWFHFMHIDLYSQRLWAQEILKQRNTNPFLINEHAVFIPVKFRESVGSKDGCYGYVRIQRIHTISSENIYLKNEVEIPYLSAPKTIINKIKDAKLLGYIYKEERKVYDLIFRKEDTIYTK